MPAAWNWLDEPELAAVIAIIRTSGGVGDKDSCTHYEQRAKKLIESLVYEHSQAHKDCSCFPDGYAIFLQSVSSNLDISQLSQPVSETSTQLSHLLAIADRFTGPQ